MRPFTNGDAAGVRSIYADTAFFGAPVERYFDDRDLFADLGVTAYLRSFPDYVYVATAGAVVAGYVLGSPSGDAGVRRENMRLLPGIAAGIVSGRYRIGRKTIAYVARLTRAALRGELLEINDPSYPANLHINVDRDYRGHGLGTALMHSYLERLRQEGVEGVHLVTTDENQAALHLYHKLGFRQLASKRTRLWRPYLGRDLSLIALGLPL